MATTEKALRESIVALGGRVVEAGLGGGLVGDISARSAESILITPSGAQYSSLRPAMIALMPLGGEYGAWAGPMKPSGEWRIHLDIARARALTSAPSYASNRLMRRRWQWRTDPSRPRIP
jgi:L-fuculose-phosphate aldolase